MYFLRCIFTVSIRVIGCEINSWSHSQNSTSSVRYSGTFSLVHKYFSLVRLWPHLISILAISGYPWSKEQRNGFIRLMPAPGLSFKSPAMLSWALAWSNSFTMSTCLFFVAISSDVTDVSLSAKYYTFPSVISNAMVIIGDNYCTFKEWPMTIWIDYAQFDISLPVKSGFAPARSNFLTMAKHPLSAAILRAVPLVKCHPVLFVMWSTLQLFLKK